jgi:hypothetical protein
MGTEKDTGMTAIATATETAAMIVTGTAAMTATGTTEVMIEIADTTDSLNDFCHSLKV